MMLMPWLALRALVALSMAPGSSPVHWLEQGQPKHAYVSSTVVAEPNPTSERAAALVLADPTARVVTSKPTMRLWHVHDAAMLLTKVPGVVVVLHDAASSSSRVRVPLGVVCGREVRPMPGLAALDWVSTHPECLPNFWYRSVSK